MKPRRQVYWPFVILCGLAAVACVVGMALLAPTLLRKGYRPGSSPEAIAYNYLMALVRQDYTRAHGYLSPALSHYPATVDAFRGDLEEHQLLPIYKLRPCVYLESVETDGDRAVVELRVQYYDPCLRGGYDFRNLSFNHTRLELQRARDEWKIVDSDGEFFCPGWAPSGR